jgi:hypothetical protein
LEGGVDHAVIKLVDLLLLAGAVANLDRASTAGLTTAMPAAELLVGIEAHGQETVDFGALKGAVLFECLVGRHENLPPILQAITLRHVRHQTVVDRPLPLDQSSPASPGTVLGQLMK